MDSTLPENRVWLAQLARKTDGEGNHRYEELFELLARYDPVNQNVERALKAGLRYGDSQPSSDGSSRTRKKPTHILFNKYDGKRIRCLYRIKVGLTTVGVVLENSREEKIEVYILPEGARIGNGLIKRSSWVSDSPYHSGRIKNLNLRAMMNKNAVLWTWFNKTGSDSFDIDGIIKGLEVVSSPGVQQAAVSALLKEGELTTTGKLLTDASIISSSVFNKVISLLEALNKIKGDNEFAKQINLLLNKLKQERTSIDIP